MVRGMRTLLMVVLLAGCGEGTSSTDAATDQGAMGDLTGTLTQCGQPGDTGNSLGVGQYCTIQGPDCPSGGGAHVLLCSALTNGSTPSPTDTFFCSFTCEATSPPDFCGENAACLCDSRGCACIPTHCIPDMGT
jgi:hypothetical protein